MICDWKRTCRGFEEQGRMPEWDGGRWFALATPKGRKGIEILNRISLHQPVLFWLYLLFAGKQSNIQKTHIYILLTLNPLYHWTIVLSAGYHTHNQHKQIHKDSQTHTSFGLSSAHYTSQSAGTGYVSSLSQRTFCDLCVYVCPLQPFSELCSFQPIKRQSVSLGPSAPFGSVSLSVCVQVCVCLPVVTWS